MVAVAGIIIQWGGTAVAEVVSFPSVSHIPSAPPPPSLDSQPLIQTPSQKSKTDHKKNLMKFIK